MCLPDVLCCSLVELRVAKVDVEARLEAWIQAANLICGQMDDALKALITETRDDIFLLAALRLLLSLSTEKLRYRSRRSSSNRVIVAKFAVVGSGSKITEHAGLYK